MKTARNRPDEGVERLLAVTRSITGELDLDRLLHSILVSAVEVTGAERGALMIRSLEADRTDPGEFEKVLYHHLDAVQMESEEFRPSRSAIQRVLEGREGLRLSDALALPNPSHSIEISGLRSILCEPLLLRDQLMGLLYLDSSKITNLFTPRHHELLRSFAAQAAICIENARLFLRVQEATRRQLEEEVRSREMEARRDLMSAFISIAAHDIKNPLSVLKGGTYVLQRLEIPEPGPQVLASMDQSVQQALRLVQNYLEFARLDNDQDLQLDRVPVELRPLVEREIELLRTRLSQERAGLFQLEVDVPEGLTVLADAGRLEQVLSNLVDNAVKYSPQGGTVRVKAGKRPDGRIAIEVSDTGVGIKREELARLFERFSRLPDMARTTSGTGLGLWITRRLVELHGWSIEVDSEPGRGTTFRILAR